MRDFGEASAKVAVLERELAEAKWVRDQLAKQLRRVMAGEVGAGEGAEVNAFKKQTPAPTATLIETVAAVEAIGGMVDTDKLAAAKGWDKTLARTRLQRAALHGLLERVSRGLYRLPQPSEQPDESDSEPPITRNSKGS